MKTKSDIKKHPDTETERAWIYRCNICNNELYPDSHYVEYGMKYAKKTFHLTCFNKMEQKELKKADLCSNNININLKQIEDFKKRISMIKFKPMVVDNVIKNVGNFKMMISDRFYNEHECDQCGQKIDRGDIYVNHGSNYKAYHFVCFQQYANKRLNSWKTYKVEVQNNLKKLEPYKSEMICESLEKE